MCKSEVKHLFDCELCGAPVTNEQVCYDGENNWCEECTDEAAFMSMSQFLPTSFVKRVKP